MQPSIIWKVSSTRRTVPSACYPIPPLKRRRGAAAPAPAAPSKPPPPPPARHTIPAVTNRDNETENDDEEPLVGRGLKRIKRKAR